MKQHLPLFVLIAVLAGAVYSGTAQSNPPSNPIHNQGKASLKRGSKDTGLAKKLQQLDARKLFARLDQDANGSISRAEFAKIFGKAKAKKSEPMDKEKAAPKQKGAKQDKAEKSEKKPKKPKQAG